MFVDNVFMYISSLIVITGGMSLIVITGVMSLIEEHIGDISGNILAMVIAGIEITIAAGVLLKYKRDQNRRMDYQHRQVCATLTSIHKIIFKLFVFKFIETDDKEYSILSKIFADNVLTLNHQINISGDLLDEKQIINFGVTVELSQKLLYMDHPSKKDFIAYAYPLRIILADIIKTLNGNATLDNHELEI